MKNIIFAILILIVLFGLIQLIPYGRNHNNPVVVSEPIWDSPATRVLAKNACFDCHSNESIWPQYASIAPISWLVYSDVINGRQHLNFSDWANQKRGEGDISQVINSGEMPPFQYTIIHRNAILDATQKQQLIIGLQNSQK